MLNFFFLLPFAPFIPLGPLSPSSPSRPGGPGGPNINSQNSIRIIHSVGLLLHSNIFLILQTTWSFVFVFLFLVCFPFFVYLLKLLTTIEEKQSVYFYFLISCISDFLFAALTLAQNSNQVVANTSKYINHCKHVQCMYHAYPMMTETPNINTLRPIGAGWTWWS